MKNHAFTLIELLVVVLIIGILSAIALPQYQVAVRKAKLAEYMTMVKAIRDAEEIHFLENGYYTDDLEALTISFPQGEGCGFYKDEYCSVYECKDSWYGVCNDVSNVQVGTKEWQNDTKLRYLQVLKEWEHSSGTYHKGDILCMAKSKVEKQVCKSLGVQRITNGSDTSSEAWYLIK